MQWLLRAIEPKHEGVWQAASAAPPVAALGASTTGTVQSEALFWLSLVVLGLQGVWWLVRIVFKVLREREAMRRGTSQATTDNQTL